jgi:hypothetical protein
MGPTVLTSLPKEGALRIFFALKNLTASAGFEPANLGTKGQLNNLSFLCIFTFLYHGLRMTRVQSRKQLPSNTLVHKLWVGCDWKVFFYRYYDCYANEDVSYKGYIILIAFPRQQQWSRERASVLRYTYIACLAYSEIHLKRTNSFCGQYADMLILKYWWYI